VRNPGWAPAGTADDGGAHAHGAVVPGRRSRRRTITSLKTQVPARCSVSIAKFCAVKRPACAARDHGHRDARALEEATRARRTRGRGLAVGGHEAPELHPAAARPAARSKAASESDPVRRSRCRTRRGNARRGREHAASEAPRATTSLSSTTVSAGARLTSAIRRSVLPPEDVVGQQDIVRHAASTKTRPRRSSGR